MPGCFSKQYDSTGPILRSFVTIFLVPLDDSSKRLNWMIVFCPKSQVVATGLRLSPGVFSF